MSEVKTCKTCRWFDEEYGYCRSPVGINSFNNVAEDDSCNQWWKRRPVYGKKEEKE